MSQEEMKKYPLYAEGHRAGWQSVQTHCPHCNRPGSHIGMQHCTNWHTGFNESFSEFMAGKLDPYEQK